MSIHYDLFSWGLESVDQLCIYCLTLNKSSTCGLRYCEHIFDLIVYVYRAQLITSSHSRDGRPHVQGDVRKHNTHPTARPICTDETGKAPQCFLVRLPSRKVLPTYSRPLNIQ